MSDNPFAEPDDPDRTIIRGPQRRVDVPTGRASAPRPPPETVAAPVRLEGEADELPRVGISPLAAAAAPLLDLLARLGATAHVDRPEELRERAVRALREFEAEARQEGVSGDQVQSVHYALCAALDDVALATPWGAASPWSARSLVSTFHQEVRSGERFFALLEGMQKDPGRYRQALEVYYLCLSLGMQGQYRLMRGGTAQLDRLREGLYELLAQLRGSWERELSPHWRGVDAPHLPVGRGVPAWTALPVTLAVLGLCYAGLAYALAGNSDASFARLAALPPAAQPAIVRVAAVVPPATAPTATPSLTDRLRQFLAPEIAQKLVTVSGDLQQTTVRILNNGMFASGSASVDASLVPLLGRIGAAMREAGQGRVEVLGHSDNQVIRSLRFPSNFALSQARAQAAAAVIQQAAGGDPGRFSAEGRGDSEPIASNATPEGREQNRRIEVVVRDRGPA